MNYLNLFYKKLIFKLIFEMIDTFYKIRQDENIKKGIMPKGFILK